MSFPRAKIKRFNDVQATTPSPADYNVDLKDKPKLVTIPQRERFAECGSPPPSETGSTKSTPCFRTPTIIKRRNVLGSATKSKLPCTNLSCKEILNEKKVECENKHAFIKELTEQLDELKNKLYNVKCEKEAVTKEKEKFESEISECREIHNVEIKHLCQKHDDEISELNYKILKLESDLQLLEHKNKELNEEKEKLESAKQQETSMLEEELNAKKEMLKKLQKTLEQAQEDKKLIENKHKQEIEALRDKHLAELQSIEVKTLNSIHDMQMALDEQKLQSQLKVKEIETSFQREIKCLKHSFNEEKESINNQHSAHISQLEEKMNEISLISEIQSTEKYSELENYWKKKLENKEKEHNEILKECQAISEYNIIQSEVEKNEYKKNFEEITNKYKVLEKKYDDIYLKYRHLQSSYSDAQNKLYRLVKENREKDVLKNQIDQMIVEKQQYQQTITRSQQTVDILKERLKESDQDVEQLKNELSNNEKKLLEYEHKFNIITDQLKEALTLNETNELNNVANLKIMHEDIDTTKKELLEKVEEVKSTYRKELDSHEKEINILREEREEHLKMLEKHQVLSIAYKDLLQKAEKEIEISSSENSECNQQIEVLKCTNEDLQSKMDVFLEKENSWNIEKKELDLKIDILKNELKQMRKQDQELLDLCAKLKEMEIESQEYKEKGCKLEEKLLQVNNKCQKLEEQNMTNLKIIEEQNALINPLKDQLESYELEMKNLQWAKDLFENEAKDLGQKYAEILGHQNIKQKIKYVEALKSKNEELSKTNIDLDSKLRNQEKEMKKLKKEIADLKRSSKKLPKFEDKENIASPNRSFKCESPGPLRNLN